MILRRRPAPALILATVAVLAAGVFLMPRARTPEHLLLVVFDTLRADRMSLYGHDRQTTPYLESLAPQLVRFTDVKTPAPWTVPAHSSLFTGLAPAVHRAQWGSMVLEERFETMAEILGKEGFCTVGYSANLLVVEGTGVAQGFDTFELVRGPWPDKTATILEKLGGEIDRRLAEGCRLFVFLNLMDTHIPYNTRLYGEAFGAPAGSPVRNARAKWEVSAGVRAFSEEDRRQHSDAYDAAVRYVDDVAAQLLSMLADRDLLDESLVVFTSDHGEGLGTHSAIGHTVSVWEEQLAIPLLVRFPHGRRGGELVTGRTGLTAVLPSVLDWMGIERPAALADAPGLEAAAGGAVGADYRSYFSERNRKTNTRTAELYPELAASVTSSHVLYCERFKLIVREDGLSFYDLTADPDELADLAPGGAPELRQCLQRYKAELERGLFTPFGAESPDFEHDDVDLEALRALGYVQ